MSDEPPKKQGKLFEFYTPWSSQQESSSSADSLSTDQVPDVSVEVLQPPAEVVTSASISSAPDDLSKRGEPHMQPRIEFPKNQASDQGDGRRFSSHWYAKYEWIEYSVQTNSIFCHTYRNFGQSRREESKVWTEVGFVTGKKLDRN